ncbi:MAG: acetolactate synthase small subunit [Bacillota bacterium]
MKQTLSVLVENKPGVLSKVSGLFSRRGFNIYSLAVGVTDDESVSRMTIVVDANDVVVEQVVKQLNKLIDVIKVKELNENTFLTRELALIKVKANASSRNEIVQIAQLYECKISDVSPTAMILETSGTTDKIDALEIMLKQYGILETMRTGAVALEKGKETI